MCCILQMLRVVDFALDIGIVRRPSCKIVSYRNCHIVIRACTHILCTHLHFKNISVGNSQSFKLKT